MTRLLLPTALVTPVLDRIAGPGAGGLRSVTPPQAAPAPSSIVTLGQTAPAPPTYPAPAVPMRAPQAGDAVGQAMLGNLRADTPAGRYQGLGAALLASFGGGVDDYAQAVSASQAPGARATSDMADQIRLDVRTAGGAIVHIVLGGQAGSLTASISVTAGQVSDAERTALAGLGEAFQAAIDGLAAEPPQLDLDGLLHYDTRAIASIDLQASVTLRPGQVQALSFHADAAGRAVEVDGPAGSVSVNVDLSHPELVGSAQRQEAALASYLRQFGDAAGRGRADRGLMQLFSEAFTALHADTASAPGPLVPVSRAAISPEKTGPGKLLTGLADFSASVQAQPDSPNLAHPEETDTFSYQVSQQTYTGGRGGRDLSVRQTQQSHLSASYHDPLMPGGALMLTPDRLTQSYYYTRIEDRASSTTDIAYRDGKLAKATLSQSVDQSTHVSKYVTGVLEDEVVTPRHEARSWNLLHMLQDAVKHQDHEKRPDTSRLQRTLDIIGNLVLLSGSPAQLLAKPDDRHV